VHFAAAGAHTVAALRFPACPAANRAASSKQPRFIRHRRRFGYFPFGSGLKWKKCDCKEYHS